LLVGPGAPLVFRTLVAEAAAVKVERTRWVEADGVREIRDRLRETELLEQPEPTAGKAAVVAGIEADGLSEAGDGQIQIGPVESGLALLVTGDGTTAGQDTSEHERPLVRGSETRRFRVSVPADSSPFGLRYNGSDIASGAQTERRGGAGPVRAPLTLA